MTEPMVSVVIPARNEERDIGACLEAVLAQNYPHDRLEVVVVDGGSVDETGAIARAVLRSSDVAWTVVDNQEGSTPSNLNAGLRAARGRILCRVDARSIVSPTHVRRCAELLDEEAARAVVGGGQRALARDGASLVERSIARALNNRWATGLATYRRRTAPGQADTVYLGAFRVTDLVAAGGWATDLPTNQDFDLNRRLSAIGMVWFDPSLTASYLPRQRLSELARQYFRFGRWKVRYWRLRSAQPSPRQRVLLLFPPAVLCTTFLLARRRPALTCAGVGAALVALDVTGVDAAASINERVVSLVAVAAIAGGWWTGVVWEGFRA